MNAGMDWTGTPDVPPEDDTGVSTILGVTIIAFSPFCDVDGFCAAMRQQYGMDEREEFHAYELTNHPEILFVLLQFVVENASVQALFWDKRQLMTQNNAIFDKPNALIAATGLAVFNEALRNHRLQRLWCDEEVKGPKNQKAFSAKLSRLQKDQWGAEKKGPHVKYRASAKSNYIQLADVCVYVLQRHIRGLKLSPELQRLAQQLWQLPGVRWGEEGDLRPYLP